MQDLLKEYEYVQEEIQSELIALKSYDHYNNVGNDNFSVILEHLYILLALLALNLKNNIDLISRGNNTYRHKMKENLNTFIETIKTIENETAISDRLICYAEDLLSIICYPDNNILNRYINWEKHSHANNLDDDLTLLFINIANVYNRMGYAQMYAKLFEGLCKLSIKRNDAESHQEIVLTAMKNLVNISPDTIIQIANDNSKFFEKCVSDYAGDFFWFYGNALRDLNDLTNANNILKKCYAIRKSVSGENDWYTILAKREYSIIEYVLSNGNSGADVLSQFIDDIEKRNYVGIDIETLKILEGKTIYILLIGRSDRSNMELHRKYLEIYEKICDEFDYTNDPLIKQRLAKNLKGEFLFRSGNYISAEQSFIEAIESKIPDGIFEIVTENQILSNLLMVYYVENDIEMALPVLDKLLIALDNDEHIGLTEEDKFRIYTTFVSMAAQNMIIIESEDINKLNCYMVTVCKNIINHAWNELPSCKKEFTAFLICSAIVLLKEEYSDINELRLYLEAFILINNEDLIFPLDTIPKVMLNYIASLTSFTINDERTGKLFNKTLAFIDNISIPYQIKAAIIQSYAIYAAKNEKIDVALSNLQYSMSVVDKIWHSYVAYMNDERLMNILAPTQIQFMSNYALLRNISTLEKAYEGVLRFKALASLAGRERNRILRSGNINNFLYNRIIDLQNNIAAYETAGIFLGSYQEYETEILKLRTLESEIALEITQNSSFTEITWDKVITALPDNSVTVEYFYTPSSYGHLQFDSQNQEMCFDIYIAQKTNGSSKLSRVTVDDNEEIIDKAFDFINILQKESNNTASIADIEELDMLRTVLYKNLIKPILPYLNGYKIVYIAPDTLLSNLPFETLYDEEQKRLIDNFTVIKIECARDFLFDQYDNSSMSDGNLIIGDPQYELPENEIEQQEIDDNEPSRSFSIDSKYIHDLPYSKVEVMHISEYSGSPCYTGASATKDLLLKGKYKNIHIATHGYFDLSMDVENDIYSSCLLFSGAGNWLKTGITSRIYKNGILTADEISRLDLRTVELVVLSSCLSGMNNLTLNKGFNGMIGAFSAAGVHYVITHLWEACDISTAIFMDAFYFQYFIQQKNPPDSMEIARNYLKNVTISELKKRNWFDCIDEDDLDNNTKNLLHQYKSMNDKVRPFRNETYWGGFTCYQCY